MNGFQHELNKTINKCVLFKNLLISCNGTIEVRKGRKLPNEFTACTTINYYHPPFIIGSKLKLLIKEK
jgi:hypothetical protein